MRDDDLVRRGQPSIGNALAARKGRFRGSLGNPRLALQRRRNERIGCGGERPRFVGKAAHPQRVELDPRGLEHAEHLDRRIGRLGLEQRVVAKTLQALQCLREGHLRGDTLELGELGERLVELGLGLEFVGVEAALAGKARRFEERGEVPRPFVRRALACGLLPHKGEKRLEPPAQYRRAVDQRHQLAQRDAHRSLLAQFRVEPRADRKLRLGAGEERRTDQPARLLERNFAASELEDGERGAHKRVVGEWRAKRNVKGKRRLFRAGKVTGRAHDARENACYFLAALSQFGNHYADAYPPPLLRLLSPTLSRTSPRPSPASGEGGKFKGRGSEVKPLERGACPACCCFQFFARRGKGDAARFRILCLRHASADLDALLRAGIQKLLRLWRDDVEGVGDEQFRFPERGFFQQRRDDVGKARRVGVAILVATLRVVPGPFGKRFGVFVSRKAPQCSRDAPLVRELPGLAAVRRGARRSKERFAPLAGANGRLPQFLFLRAGEEQRKLRGNIGVKRIFVESLDESAEWKNVRGFPDREAGCGLPIVEFARKCLREAPVRRHDGNSFGMSSGETREELALLHCWEFGADGHGA